MAGLAFQLHRRRSGDERSQEQGITANDTAAATSAPTPTPPRASSLATPDLALEPEAVKPEPPITQPAVTGAPTLAPETHADIDMSFEPVGLRLSLVYATLQYRVSLKTHSPLAASRLLGDMIGAHASIPAEQQLAPAFEAYALLKNVPQLAAGESVTLTGEIQLPLNAIRALQTGKASFFVPLVRLCLVEGDTAQPDKELLRRIYTVGAESTGTALAPLRLDTGPRDIRGLAAREVEQAREYPLPSRPSVG